MTKVEEVTFSVSSVVFMKSFVIFTRYCFPPFFDQVALGVFVDVIERLNDPGHNKKVDDSLVFAHLLFPDQRADQVKET